MFSNHEIPIFSTLGYVRLLADRLSRFIAMKLRKGIQKQYFVILVLFCVFLPFLASADVVINEVMYDLEGTDSGREWVELYNSSGAEVDLTGWKFNDGSNHNLNNPPKNGGQGLLAVPAGGYIVLSGDAEIFLSEHIGFGGTVIDTVMSLNNTADTLTILDSEGVEVDSMTYQKEVGANGDGMTLQLVGGEWKVGTPTPGAVNSSDGSGLEPSGDDQDSPGESDASDGETSPSGVDWPIEPQIFAYAGADQTGVAGGDIVFVGEALGIKKEPLGGARYLWNFGDGTTKEGKKVRHSYKHPSDYIVFLNVSSGKYSASDKVLVKVVPSQLKITEANEEFIKLNNDLNMELNISGWFISLGNGVSKFRFPEATFIGAKSSLPISSDVSGINVGEEESINLLYPNGSVAFSYPTDLTENASPEVAPIIQNSTPSKTIVNTDSAEQSKEPNSSNGSNNSNQASAANEANEASAPGGNIANVISITDKSKPISIKWWVALIGLVGVCGGVALKFNKENEIPKTAEESVEDYIDEIEEVE